MKRLFSAIRKIVMRVLAWFDRIPAEDCIVLNPIQQYMLESEAEWQIAFLEYCWQLDSARHYHD